MPSSPGFAGSSERLRTARLMDWGSGKHCTQRAGWRTLARTVEKQERRAHELRRKDHRKGAATPAGGPVAEHRSCRAEPVTRDSTVMVSGRNAPRDGTNPLRMCTKESSTECLLSNDCEQTLGW